MTPNGEAIRAIREAQKIGLRELARRIQRNRGYLSHLERGHIQDVADDTVIDIARALGVPTTAITHREKT